MLFSSSPAIPLCFTVCKHSPLTFTSPRMFAVSFLILFFVVVSHSKNSNLQEYVYQTWGENMDKLWLKYVDFGLEFCVFKSSRMSIQDFKENSVVCVHQIFLKKKVCNGMKNESFERRIITEYKRRGTSPVPISYNILILIKTNTEPMAQTCVTTYYFGHNNINQTINEQVPHLKDIPNNFDHKNTVQYERLKIQFRSTMFGMNITFTTFSLSDMCVWYFPKQRLLDKSKLFYYRLWNGTEYVLVSTNNKARVYLCMKRPQWSLFTAHKTGLDYNVCFVCMNQVSSIVFEYQVMDGNFLNTIEDNWYFILGDRLKQDQPYLLEQSFVSSKLKNKTCVLKYFLLVQKFQCLKVWKQLGGQVLIFSTDAMQKNKYMFQIWDTKIHHLQYFSGMLEVIAREKHVDFYGVHYQGLMVIKENITNQHTQENVKMLAPSEALSLGHLVFNLSVSGDEFLQITIQTLLFKGLFRMFSCFYGGISIFEKNENSNGDGYTEMISLCQNHTVNEAKESQIHNANPHFVYTSSSNEALLVLHATLGHFVNTTFALSTATCRGIFINTCSEKAFPFASFPHVNFFEILNNGCVSLQFGTKYLPLKLHHRQRYPGRRNPRKRCHQIFVFPVNNSWCSAEIEYTRTFHTSQYFTLPFFDQYVTDLFLVRGKITLSSEPFSSIQNTSCTEHISDERYYFGKKSRYFSGRLKDERFRAFQNERKYAAPKAGYFQMNLTIQFVHSASELNDTLISTQKPFSQSSNILTLTYHKCKQQASVQLLSGVSSLSANMRSVCLREPARAGVPINTLLQVSLEGETSKPKDNLGHLMLYSLLCISNKWFKESGQENRGHEVVFAVQCPRNQHNMGEDKLVWTQNVSVGFSNTLGNSLIVDLSGKIFHASFTPDQTDHCRKCTLHFTWRKIPKNNTAYRGGKVHDIYQPPSTTGYKLSKNVEFFFRPGGLMSWHEIVFYEMPLHFFEIVSRNLHRDYQEPEAVTWYKARETCSNLGKQLPSFASEEDTLNMADFIKAASFTALVTSLYIGIHQQVCFHDNRVYFHHFSARVGLYLEKRFFLND